jgi:hypothetical protein
MQDSEAREAYRRFVAEGIALGRRPELVGWGLTRMWVLRRETGIRDVVD